MSLLQVVNLVEGILNTHSVNDVRYLPWNYPAARALESAGFKTRTVMQIWQNIAQITETLKESDLPMGKGRSRVDKHYGTLLAHAFWEGFHMQVMVRRVTGRYASPVYGGEWTTGRTALLYSPLILLPLKKSIIDGSPILQWLMPIPVEWLIERDWWTQTHSEDNDSRGVYRQLLCSPILRDMISTARLYPGARPMIIKLDMFPPPAEKKPRSANVFTVSVMMHRYLISSQELGVLYSLMSADYLLDLVVKANFDTCGTIKSEMVMRVIKWNMAKETRKARLHKVEPNLANLCPELP